jgi:hypothetical protein
LINQRVANSRAQIATAKLRIALERLVEPLRIRSIEARQIRIEQDQMAANAEDQRLELLIAQCFSHVACRPGSNI